MKTTFKHYTIMRDYIYSACLTAEYLDYLNITEKELEEKDDRDYSKKEVDKSHYDKTSAFINKDEIVKKDFIKFILKY